jgi:hypothetical protein
MVLRIGTEYLYVEALSGTGNLTAAVSRAYNGSIAAAHDTGTAIYRWKALPAVQSCIVRLIQLALEQDKSPTFGQRVIGDFTFPTTVDSYPKDVIAAVRNGGLFRLPRITAI